MHTSVDNIVYHLKTSKRVYEKGEWTLTLNKVDKDEDFEYKTTDHWLDVKKIKFQISKMIFEICIWVTQAGSVSIFRMWH